MNWIEIAKSAKGEIRKLVGTYLWRPPSKDGADYDVIVSIDIYQYPDGRFQASPSHYIKSSQQDSPYASISLKLTSDEALNDCINGFSVFMERGTEIAWIPVNQT